MTARIDQDGLFETFAAEAAEHVRTLSTLLLALERDSADRSSVREMFLAAHTLKGSAAMMGMQTLAALAHRLEDVLQRLREPAEPFDSKTADLLFRCLDVASALAQNRPDSDTPTGTAYAELLEALQNRSQARGATPEDPRGVSLDEIESTKRVLLVEDSATVRMSERLALEDAGYEVSEATDVEEAGSVALARGHDLIVVGHQLRDGFGLELAERLRNNRDYRGTPIILTCAEVNGGDSAAMTELGVHVTVRQGPEGQDRLIRLAVELLGDVPPSHRRNALSPLEAVDTNRSHA